MSRGIKNGYFKTTSVRFFSKHRSRNCMREHSFICRKTGIEKIKDKTATDGDNKAYDLISKISGILSKAIDYVTANTQHK